MQTRFLFCLHQALGLVEIEKGPSLELAFLSLQPEERRQH